MTDEFCKEEFDHLVEEISICCEGCNCATIASALSQVLIYMSLISEIPKEKFIECMERSWDTIEKDFRK